MKSLILVPFLALGAVAQDPPQEPKVPQPPSRGVHDKLTPPPLLLKAPLDPAATVPAPADAASPPARDKALDPTAAAAAAHGRSALLQALADPRFVAFDQPQADGPVWVAGSNYKVRFDAGAWAFVGKPLPGATDLQPIAFRLAGVQVAGTALRVADVAPVRQDRRVEYAHGDVVQAIDVRGDGVEQTFTFARLPQRGELVIDLVTTTGLAVEQDATGLRFRGPFDDVGYSAAVAIDANGNRVAAPTTCADGRITIRVPAGFVESAALPLRVDPWVHAIAIATDTHDLGDPDIAWDETGQVWAVTYARYFGGSDWDCYVQRVSLGNPMVLVGSLTVVDLTTDAWQRPRIANLGAYDEFMVVAQVKSGTNPYKIAGRILGNSGSLVTGQFDVSSASAVDAYHPDIGGDPASPPTYFTVVWEHAYSATDHDIYARQVTATGALRGTGNTFVQTNTRNQSWPTVSKSDGAAPFATQRFTIVYQDKFAAGDEDVHGAMLTWDGQFVPVGGSNTFPIDTSGYNDTFPQVSSPALQANDGSRKILAVYERTNANNGDVAATCIDQAGGFVAGGNLTELENDPLTRSWPQLRPSVDCDGLRFVVGFHQLYNNNPTVNDLDTRVTLVGAGGGALLVEERTGLALSTNREFNVQVATRYSGTGVHSPNANTTHDRDNATSGFAIDAYSYDSAPQPSFVVRPTMCGTLGITPSGQPMIGGTFTITLSQTPWLAGIAIGMPVNVPLPPCPSCTLGVQGTSVIGRVWSLTVPPEPAFIGATLATQGWVFDGSGGPCLGQLRLSDTVDIRIF